MRWNLLPSLAAVADIFFTHGDLTVIINKVLSTNIEGNENRAPWEENVIFESIR